MQEGQNIENLDDEEIEEMLRACQSAKEGIL